MLVGQDEKDVLVQDSDFSPSNRVIMEGDGQEGVAKSGRIFLKTPVE